VFRELNIASFAAHDAADDDSEFVEDDELWAAAARGDGGGGRAGVGGRREGGGGGGGGGGAGGSTLYIANCLTVGGMTWMNGNRCIFVGAVDVSLCCFAAPCCITITRNNRVVFAVFCVCAILVLVCVDDWQPCCFGRLLRVYIVFCVYIYICVYIQSSAYICIYTRIYIVFCVYICVYIVFCVCAILGGL